MGPEGKIELSGLRQAYQLLSDLGDAVGKHFVREFHNQAHELKKALNARNESILAHGFRPIRPQTAEKIRRLVESYMDMAVPAWKERAQAVAFPRLELP
jgi:hypothetical protein